MMACLFQGVNGCGGASEPRRPRASTNTWPDVTRLGYVREGRHSFRGTHPHPQVAFSGRGRLDQVDAWGFVVVDHCSTAPGPTRGGLKTMTGGSHLTHVKKPSLVPSEVSPVAAAHPAGQLVASRSSPPAPPTPDSAGALPPDPLLQLCGHARLAHDPTQQRQHKTGEAASQPG
jgi:hypothetical protein